MTIILFSGVFSSDIVASIRKVVETRYTLLPYLYSLFFKVHTIGGTVVRSLVHEFSKDKNTHEIDEQFLWGSALLISPVIEQGKTQVTAYFPKASRWYNYYTGQEVVDSSSYVTVAAPRDTIPLHVRGGYIIPTQESAANTDQSRQKPFGLIIAPDKDKKASGELYWDVDGVTEDPIGSNKYNLYDFEYNQNLGELNSRVIVNNLISTLQNPINTIRVFDCNTRPASVLINGLTPHSSYSYNAATKELVISSLQVQFNRSFFLKFNCN